VCGRVNDCIFGSVKEFRQESFVSRMSFHCKSIVGVETRKDTTQKKKTSMKKNEFRRLECYIQKTMDWFSYGLMNISGFSLRPLYLSHLYDRHSRYITCSGTTKDEAVTLHMHVRQPVRH
jgi:hypothetical protein